MKKNPVKAATPASGDSAPRPLTPPRRVWITLASLAAAVFAPVYYVFGNGVAWAMDKSILMAITVMAGLLFWRHAENMSRLVKGTESRLGKKSPPNKP
jgi:hypothetical protein